MSHLAHRHYDKGGMCYAACQEAFEWYSSLMIIFYLGGTLQFIGVKRDVILQKEECQNLFLGI